jgi:BioD-like phosphotransacetylase family protein
MATVTIKNYKGFANVAGTGGRGSLRRRRPGGHRPPAALLGTAEKRGVPVLLAAGDTLSVIERAESVLDTGRARDEGTVDRMRDLLHDHADIDAILGDDGTEADSDE